MKNKPLVIYMAIGALVIIGILIYFKGLFIAAIVNGRPISRFTVTKELEKQGGKKTLDSIITQELISQEAQKKGINIKDTDVDNEIKKIEKSIISQGQNLDQLLAAQGMDRSQLKSQIRTKLYLEKILANKIKVSDKEIDNYLQKIKDQPQNGVNKKPNKEEIIAQLMQQKLSKEAPAFIAELKKSAKITTFVSY